MSADKFIRSPETIRLLFGDRIYGRNLDTRLLVLEHFRQEIPPNLRYSTGCSRPLPHPANQLF